MLVSTYKSRDRYYPEQKKYIYCKFVFKMKEVHLGGLLEMDSLLQVIENFNFYSLTL
jgi:hypothetical protein